MDDETIATPNIPLDEDIYCLLLAAACGDVEHADAAYELNVSGAQIDEWIHEALMHAARLIGAK